MTLLHAGVRDSTLFMSLGGRRPLGRLWGMGSKPATAVSTVTGAAVTLCLGPGGRGAPATRVLL